jgi:hypothetical protein
MHVTPMDGTIKKGIKAYASMMIPNTYHIYIYIYIYIFKKLLLHVFSSSYWFVSISYNQVYI